ncbi:hypothetical protein OSTOST_14642 [Ostertagia ostertagi]
MVLEPVVTEKIPGFNVSGVDQDKRKNDQQEQVNRAVLSKFIRVLFFPNPEKLPLKEIVNKFLKEVMNYNVDKDGSALCWFKQIGSKDETIHFKAEMSYQFWQHFLDKGRRALLDYNKSKKTSIKVVRGHTIKAGDTENLSLYLRLKIRDFLEREGLPVPEISVKNAFITIRAYNGELVKMRSTVLATKLGWSYKDWHGTPILFLMSDSEKEAYEEGKLKWGSHSIETILGVDKLVQTMNEKEQEGNENSSKERAVSRKREASNSENLTSKIPRCDENVEEEAV